ncbi:unnamed protein product, partial [Linum tenue]
MRPPSLPASSSSVQSDAAAVGGGNQAVRWISINWITTISFRAIVVGLCVGHLSLFVGAFCFARVQETKFIIASPFIVRSWPDGRLRHSGAIKDLLSFFNFQHG